MRTIITAVIAAAIIGAGAFAATAVVGGQATAQESGEPGIEQQDRPHKGAILEETLSELVADGTITQAQAGAITDALAAKVEEHQAERQANREQRQAVREQFRSAIEDDVIDSDELAELQAALPDAHWLNDPDSPAAPYLQDGELTSDELSQFREELHGSRQHRKGDASASSAEPTGAQV